MLKASLIVLRGAVVGAAGGATAYSHPSVQLSDGPVQLYERSPPGRRSATGNVVLQGFDYSCGGALMATLLACYFLLLPGSGH
jgi:hypothetical protein